MSEEAFKRMQQVFNEFFGDYDGKDDPEFQELKRTFKYD